MPSTAYKQNINGLDFHVEESGSGEPLVLVHGSWGSTRRWDLIVDDLADSFHVVAYDRRGYGHSDLGPVPRTRRDEEDDLAALIEALGIGPAHLVGNSFGAGIVLSVAARRPDVVRTVCGHEPPLADLARDDARVQQFVSDTGDVLGLIEDGRHADAARDFVERVAVGPGGWEATPSEVQDALIRAAGAFAAEQSDPHAMGAEFDGLARPALLTEGDSSLAWFTPVMAGARKALPQAEFATIAGAGHIPHITHPEEYVELIRSFAGAG
jgi:pimeloyl-ACP methyl ester carboxylesterase